MKRLDTHVRIVLYRADERLKRRSVLRLEDLQIDLQQAPALRARRFGAADRPFGKRECFDRGAVSACAARRASAFLFQLELHRLSDLTLNI